MSPSGWIFCVCVALVFWTWAGYPLVMLVWGTLFARRAEHRYEAVPVSVVVAARNEEINIRARVENLLDQDYSGDLEVIVVSDGSTDRTGEVVRWLGDERVRLIETGRPVGKAIALNTGVAAATGEVVVFADARQRFARNVVAELVAYLFSPEVGAVSGELVIEPGVASEVGEGVGFYWAYEKFLRRMESRAASVVGATGCIYAVRRALYVPLEEGTLLDDVMIPMRIVLQGRRVLFTRSARAYDISSASTGQEFRRKMRTLAGNVQMVAMEPGLLNARRNPILFQLVSHKLMRLAAPWCLVGALCASGVSHTPVFRVLFLLQVAFYAMALAQCTPIARSPAGRLTRLAWTFVTLNAAAVAGTVIYISGRSGELWKTEQPQA